MLTTFPDFAELNTHYISMPSESYPKTAPLVFDSIFISVSVYCLERLSLNLNSEI